MDVLLSHTTALEVLRAPELRGRLSRVAGRVEVPGHAPSRAELKALLASVPLLRRAAQPLELLVSGTRRARSDLALTHAMTVPPPAGSAFEVARGVRCVSPEQVAVQMAPALTELGLVVLLSELMGLYAVAPFLEWGMFQRREPLTTPELVRAHLDALGRFPGVAQVRLALTRACVRSGSPRETKLSLRLGLKPALGGYHLRVLSMNEPLKVRRIHARLGSGVRKPDILLLAAADRGTPDATMPFRGVAVEYDGAAHYDEARHERDVIRHNELQALGFKEYVVGRRQYESLAYMDGLVRQVRDDLGLARIGLTRAEERRRRELRLQLFEELERIDGVAWDGRARELARSHREGVRAGGGQGDEVPVEAYGLR